jgi:hypothetical protein
MAIALLTSTIKGFAAIEGTLSNRRFFEISPV